MPNFAARLYYWRGALRIRGRRYPFRPIKRYRYNSIIYREERLSLFEIGHTVNVKFQLSIFFFVIVDNLNNVFRRDRTLSNPYDIERNTIFGIVTIIVRVFLRSRVLFNTIHFTAVISRFLVSISVPNLPVIE